MKQHGKKARQERALERLKKAKVENSIGCFVLWNESGEGNVSKDDYAQHDRNWQERRDKEIAILEKRIARK